MPIPSVLLPHKSGQEEREGRARDANVSAVFTGPARLRTLTLLATLLASALAGSFSVSGCSDSGTGGAGGSTPACGLDDQNCFDYSCYEAGPDRSFAADVLPIFEQSCALSASCHGDPGSPDPSSGYRPYLGAVDGPSDVMLIFDTVVDQDSHRVALKMIDPGKPESSFLMHKMDGDLECGSLACPEGDCGTLMPQSSDPLPEETRNTVRDWILQGAANN